MRAQIFSLKYAQFAVIVLLSFALVGLASTAGHWWTRSGSASVSSDRVVLHNPKVYLRGKNAVLIFLENDGVYLVHPYDYTIGMCGDEFFVWWSKYAYSKELDPPFARMNPVKSVEPHLKIDDSVIEFDSINSGRIHVDLSK